MRAYTPSSNEQAEIRDNLYYFPVTGKIINLKDRGPARSGQEAGSLAYGYQVININGRRYYTHRIAWFLYHRAWPPAHLEIDHINGKKDDNRIINLRLVDHATNIQNRHGCQSNNQTGHLNIHRQSHHDSWRVWIKRFGKATSKTFSDSKYGGRQQALDAAIEWRDSLNL